jgi:hypothetical protein
MKNPYAILLLITFALRLATALPLRQAGYMDASYTMHVAENLARGRGLVVDVLWNYLDNPAGLPHPSNLYWMPLPSFLVAPFYALFGASYRVAQIPFIILSSFLPLVTFYFSRRIFVRDDYAWAAALFTAFSGFYTIYWVSPDNFTPFALTASLCLFFISRGLEREGAGDASANAQQRGRGEGESGRGGAEYFFVAGILAGLSHLSRADGLLLVIVAPIVLIVHAIRNTQSCPEPSRRDATRITFHPFGFAQGKVSRFTFYFLLGYLLLMSPWFARNYLAVGSPYPSTGTKTLWLTNYDEMFRYADDLTLSRYLAWGVGSIIESKVVAAFRNIFIILFSDLQLFLAPFALIGLWQLRRRVEMLPFFFYAVLLYLVMTFAFTFPSWRGSLFHSASAFLPFLAVAVPPGVDAAVHWVARRRRTWEAALAARFFRVGFVVLAVFFSIFLYAQGVFGALVGGSSDIPLWNQRDAAYPPLARWLDQNARADDIVMVVDPPTFYNLSHRRAIIIPTDSVDAVFDAAQRYGARYLILEFDHPKPLRALYRREASVPGLTRVADFRDGMGRPAILFEVAH